MKTIRRFCIRLNVYSIRHLRKTPLLAIALFGFLSGCASSPTYSGRNLYPALDLDEAQRQVSASIAGADIDLQVGEFLSKKFIRRDVLDFYLEPDAQHIYLFTKDKNDDSYHACRYSISTPTIQFQTFVDHSALLLFTTEPMNDTCPIITGMGTTDSNAHAFADALTTILNAPKGMFAALHSSERDSYRNWAKSYHNMNVAAVIPEELEKQDTLTQAALQERNYIKATAGYYWEVTEMPYWARAHYNLALLLADAKDYPGAVREMSRYLLLLPDASDSEKIQKQIWIWQSEVPQDFTIDTDVGN